MIGWPDTRRVAMAIFIALVVGVGLGLRSADPSRADPPVAADRMATLRAAAAAADGAVTRLNMALASALDHARLGAALTVAGDADPAAELILAAERLAADSTTADAARRSLAALAGTTAAIAPGTAVPALDYNTPGLLVIATQLRASAEAATVFVARRHATETIIGALGRALAALDRDLPASALEGLDTATAPMQLLEAWEGRPQLMQYWMTTSGRLLEAARGIATATLAGDPANVKAAAARYAEAAKLAQGADNALAVSLSEEGAAVSGTPLRRLAVAASEAKDLRAALQPLVHGGS
ncbi:MAG: hypothetical protein ABI578_02735 [Chloroflexota bacterium]